MISFMRKLWKSKRGNVLAIAAACFPLFLGAAGLASDTIQWTLWKRQLQRAADSAAIAGVYDRINHANATTNVPTAVAHDLTLNNHAFYSLKGGLSSCSGTCEISYPADSGSKTDQVTVKIQIQQPLTFSSIFLSTAPTITATSTAASVPGTGEYCVVALENSASQTGITIGGNANVEMDCGMISNSPATNSALSNGTSSKVKATTIAAVGGVQSSNSWTVDSYEPYTSAITDPYASLPMTSPSSCSNWPNTNDLDYSSDPNHAAGKVVCYKSDMKIQGNVTLGAATYVLDAASLKMTATGASLTCNGCTIILTTSGTDMSKIGTVSISGGTLNLVAPTSGTYQGVSIYQDRRALDSAGNNIINGNSGSTVKGTIYMPGQQLTYNGDGTTTAICTQFVTRRIIFGGSNTTSNKFAKASSCGSQVAGTIGGGRRVRLVG
jgi:Flp pilus assembly protein TadG